MTNRYKYAIGRRFVARKGGYMESKFFPGATGLITAIKGDNLSYKMDHETKKRVAPTRSFLQNNVDLLDEEQEEGQESVTDN